MSKPSTKTTHNITIINGQICMGVDAWTGEPITRSKSEHPYNYQSFELFSNGEKGERSMYSDRMYSWDADKYNRCCHAIWGDHGQRFDLSRTPKEIEHFLRLYVDDDTLVLTRIVEDCSPASGSPTWHFAFKVSEPTPTITT